MKQNNNAIKAVIFDFDDTLVNTKELALKRHKMAAEKAGLAWDDSEFLKRYGEPWPDLLQGIFGNETERFVKIFYGLGPFEGKSVEGADEVVKKIHSKKAVLGVLSSSPRDVLVQRFERELDTSSLFDRNIIVSKEDVKKCKPNKEAFSTIISYLGSKNIRPHEVIYVGDHLSDFEAAKNAGINFIAVTTGANNEQEFMNAGLNKERIIPTIRHLPDKMEKLGML